MRTLFALAFVLAITAAPYATLGPRQSGKYRIDDRVLIRAHDGATISAIVVLPAIAHAKLPTAFTFTIYADEKTDLQQMEYAADRGYAGVWAYTRGKMHSPQTVVPYEYDGRDADSVISWIARQPWSDGQVGMYGGSYNGFTTWAAAKYTNPALKTIVPYVANNPGNGLPMQNNIFLLVNYPWVYYVTNNKFLDDAAYSDPRFNGLARRWFASGRAYRAVPSVAGTPNPWFEKWIGHPSYDAYWQTMLPYETDFARINVPVLVVDGYYDDGQISELAFFNDLNRYNPRARSYLIIGPWDHLGTQHRVKDAVLRGYHIDPVAQVDTPKLTFDWFDYVMRGKPKPLLVQDHVNYEVMGANVWKHAPSISAMGTPVRLYLTNTRVSRRFYLLSTREPASTSLRESVDMADRIDWHNADSYPSPIVDKKPDLSSGYAFVTQPFSSAVDASGFDGVIHTIINKRDMDIGLVLYEMLPNGRLMELSYYLGRASYARDMNVRELLTPGKEAVIPFDRSFLFSKRIEKGSRLLLTLDVNMNPFAQVNYGTGKDVSSEDIHDAKTPLEVQWLTSSYIRIRTAASR
jgi:uncharacterized protein